MSSDLKFENYSDIVLSTRIRFARNLNNFFFVNRNDFKKNIQILNYIEEKSKKILNKNEFFLRLSDMDENTLNSLFEKHLISKELLKNKEICAIITNNDNSLVTLINEEDIFRMQSFSKNFNINDCYTRLSEFEKAMSSVFDFAYSDKLGYITACPTNLGCATRVSVMLHLEALSKIGMLNQILEEAVNSGAEIRGMYGENTTLNSNIYQISNKQTLGKTVEDVIAIINNISLNVIKAERKARNILKQSNTFYNLEDSIYRDYGILKNARYITEAEALKILLNIRLGVTMGINTHISIKKIDELIDNIKKYSLKKILKDSLDTIQIENFKRASYLREEID